ncbi:MAG: hypothetical protein IKY89_05715 [Alistipes sp.]|nr:hypothetical protein [Alistipes sp.]
MSRHEKDREILKAARILHDHCKRTDRCVDDCPLNGCGCMGDSPEFWQLPENTLEPKPNKLAEVKTVRRQMDYAEKFDEALNQALATGWTLVKREVVNPATPDEHIMLYAELERYEND